MKLGIFGGSFNPLHNGHIMMARHVRREFALDEVRFIVANTPPHKELAFDVPARLRFEMTRAALEGEAGICASDMELGRPGKSYTIDTVRELRRENADAELFLIVGEDMLENLPTWKSVEELLRKVSVITVSRPGCGESIYETAKATEHRFNTRVYVSEVEGLDISSTQVRRNVFDALPVSALVPEPVERAIYENMLYQPTEIVDIYNKLCESLKPSRVRHICGVVGTAVELAAQYGADGGKARLAALLHDCAKLGDEALLTFAQERGMPITEFERNVPELLHDSIGAMLAQEIYGVRDAEVIKAIQNHQKLNVLPATMLDKVVFLADKIEPGRSYARVAKIRELARSDMNRALIEFVDSETEHIRDMGQMLHPAILDVKRRAIMEIQNKDETKETEDET